MKTSKFLYSIAVVVAITLSSCGESGDSSAKHENHEHATEYSCPMKCEGEKTYPEEGSCPVCGMDLVEI